MTPGPATPLILSLANFLAPVELWWREAKMWTLMYRGGLLAAVCALVTFVLWRIVAARRERVRLEGRPARNRAQWAWCVS